MKSKVFGALVTGAVAGLVVGNVALADGKKLKHKKAGAEKCWASSCKESVSMPDGSKGPAECKGHQACKTFKGADDCSAAGGVWQKDAPKDAPAK